MQDICSFYSGGIYPLSPKKFVLQFFSTFLLAVSKDDEVLVLVMQRYMINAYRVLLTRACQGIIICIPNGNSRLTPEGFPEDSTRLPEFYDGTYKLFEIIRNKRNIDYSKSIK